MSKKTIVLADNSYTIRRIVELSFSDETDIDLLTFENGLNLREKLLELHPQIVLVDIKLPEFNGYDLCYFVQTTDALKQTKVFLLKGGFEPIDEGLLQGLKYEDIITKPFDSNALVSNIKKLLETLPDQAVPGAEADVPSSFPEDEEELPDIEAMPGTDKDISFSDVKEEIESEEEILPAGIRLGPTPGSFSDEEILPSEEITRAQPDKDTISPAFDDEDNPFMDEMSNASLRDFSRDENTDHLTDEEFSIKQNIQLQEKELEIDSLTLEEINIKRDIERKDRERSRINSEQDMGADMVIADEAEEVDADTSDMFPDAKLEPQEDLFSFAKQKAEPESPDFDSDEDFLSKKTMPEPELPEIKYEQEMDRDNMMGMEMPEPGIPSEEEDIRVPDELRFDSEPESLGMGREYEIPDFDTPSMPSTSAVNFDEDIPGLEPSREPLETKKVEELGVPDVPDVPAEPKIPEKPEVPVMQEKPKVAAPPPKPPQARVEKKIPERPEISEIPRPPKPTPPPPPQVKRVKEFPGISTEGLLDKIEDKLTMSIKEMLWEVVPPLAEKIIQQEIEALKEEAEDSLR